MNSYLKFAILLLLNTLLLGGNVSAETGKVLHLFRGTPDGGGPESALVADGHGNLFGTTFIGGTGGACPGGCGTVYELEPSGSGYTERVIYSFQGELVDGSNPEAPLIFDAQGNLYGTTLSGGVGLTGAGTVFELSPSQDGTWQETVLRSFNGGEDGGNLQGGLIFDSAGNLYGTAAGGGTGTGCAGGIGCGLVFELSPVAGGWQETVLHNFTNNHSDGWSPYAGFIADSAGNLYSTTYYGGSEPMGGGTVFMMSNTPTGWQESILYNFRCEADGCSPYSSLARDSAGNLYGTTVGGGTNRGAGVVYKLTLGSNGTYTQSVIHSFGSGNDGLYPYGNPILDSNGNLYGTTDFGGGGTNSGCSNGCGTVYKLIPSAGGSYSESILARLGNGSAGIGPLTGLIMNAQGDLFGTIAFDGTGGAGSVFELIP
jgi:uncharacterized repeat protein (TIGR03803 family)